MLCYTFVMKMKKLSSGIVVAIVIVCALYIYYASLQKTVSTSSVICSADTKVCSDGSYIARSGPNCEFAFCPGETVVKRSDSVVGIGQTITLDGVNITPLAVISDSRCPDGVQCIQRGNVDLSIKLGVGLLEKIETVRLGSYVDFSGKRIALLNMTSPKKESLSAGIHSKYDFEFSVK